MQEFNGLSITQNRYALREYYEHFLTNKNNRYHLTISFSFRLNDRKCTELLNVLIYRLNKNIFKEQYRRGNKFLEGFAIKEETPGQMDNIHFHLILQDENNMLNHSKLEYLLKKHISKIQYQSNTNQTITKYYLQAYESDHLEHYLTKNFEKRKYSVDQCVDMIGYLGSGNVLFG